MVRVTSGQSLLEAVLGIAIFIFAVLLMVDLSSLVMAAQINDSACKSAARAAAAGDPLQSEKRAEACLHSLSKGDGGWISDVHLVRPVKTIIKAGPVMRKDPFTGKYVNGGGAVDGSVIVSSELAVRPVFVHLFFGKNPPIKLTCSHECPISYVAAPQKISSSQESDEEE